MVDGIRKIDRNVVLDPLADETWRACESVIRAFEDAWNRSPSPSIDEFLVVEEGQRSHLLRELIHVDLEFCVKRGQRECVETYLQRYPLLATEPETVLDLITAEYGLRRRFEPELSIEEYSRRFPELQHRIQAHLLRVQGTVSTGVERPSSAPAQAPSVPGYEIISELGRGGMGVVYQALETSLGRHVALKFVTPDVAGEADLMQRFVREAKTASSLNHPHICMVHALEEHEARPFIVLEHIEGQTLRSIASSGRVPVPEVLRLIRQAASALAAAHAAGVVHRDIKPENMMVRPDGILKVLDFGLARRLPTLVSSAGAGSHDTWPGGLLGTVAYMSPEQSRGEPLNGASDIFSLGIVLYFLVTGRHPFERDTPFSTLHAIANEPPTPVSRLNPSLSTAVEGLIDAMLNKDSRLRPTAGEVERALAAIGRAGRAARESAPKQIVHREQQLRAIREALVNVEAGRGGMICIAGEPGIGKSTLVEDFLNDLRSRDHYQIARGRCSERQVAATAYLPIVDALADLQRGETGGAVSRLVGVVAPTWAAQLSQSERPIEPSSSLAFSQQAMLREMVRLLTEISRLGTVVLFVDDVHWADASTVDLLAYLGDQLPALPVLIIVAYRPTELLLSSHSFHRVKLELQAQGVCTELSLGFLERSQIENYLAMTFPDHRFPADFADLVHSRTEGSPLFMVDLLRYLREQGFISRSDGRWSLARELPEIWQGLPETVRSMIQRKLERLDNEDLRLLSAASAQGHQFDSAVVGEAIGRDAEAVEERLQALDRVHGLVRLMREDEFPDGTPTLRYCFVHVLYQQAVYLNLLPTRRRAISSALANAWKSHLGDDPGAFAAELACLYEAGREGALAAGQFFLAAQHAARVFAHHDAVMLARRGLSLLSTHPRSAERDKLELPLQTLLGLQLQVTEGYGARSAELVYERARELCTASDASLFPVLWGLWLVRKVRSELPRARELARELLALARKLNDPDLALQAHQALGLTALCLGEPAVSLHHVEQVAALYDPERHRQHAFLFGQDPGVICKAYGAIALWLLGFPDAAQLQSDQAIEMSRGLSPNSQSVALHFAAMVFQLCRNAGRTRECADACTAISSEHGFPFWLGGGTVIGGWALAVEGKAEAGLTRLKLGLDMWRTTGSVTYLTYYLGLLADSLQMHGDAGAAIEALEQALDLVARTGESMIEPELHRLKGELLLRIDGSPSPDRLLAEKEFRKALEVAKRQEARLFEVRAAVSLTKLQNLSGLHGDGRDLLGRILKSFSEGFETLDLKEAKAIASN